ncbi:MAG: hypothetical protein ACYCWW_18560 [Deltaproteobacteria bacterium]
MEWPSLKRGILKVRVARVRKAFGGLLGGILGFAAEGFSVPHILRVSLPITTYHLPSGDLHTRTSRAVATLIALQPRTARVVRNGQEVGDRIEEAAVEDRVRRLLGAVPAGGTLGGCATTSRHRQGRRRIAHPLRRS